LGHRINQKSILLLSYPHRKANDYTSVNHIWVWGINYKIKRKRGCQILQEIEKGNGRIRGYSARMQVSINGPVYGGWFNQKVVKETAATPTAIMVKKKTQIKYQMKRQDCPTGRSHYSFHPKILTQICCHLFQGEGRRWASVEGCNPHS